MVGRQAGSLRLDLSRHHDDIRRLRVSIGERFIERGHRLRGRRHVRALEIIDEGRGTHFDPEVVDALMQTIG